MEIKIKNKIEVDGKIEELEESFPCRKEIRAGKTYLIYENAQNEKVIIKFDEQGLTRIERSDALKTFSFVPGKITESYYEGLGWLKIKTLSYQIKESSLLLEYQLLIEEQLLGNYSMELSYE